MYEGRRRAKDASLLQHPTTPCVAVRIYTQCRHNAMPDLYNLPATLDLSRLLILHSVLGTLTAASSSSPSYNLPIALFGLFVVEKNSNEGLRHFGALHALSFVLDVFWLLFTTKVTTGVVTFLLLINMAAKPITLLAVSSTFKAQGVPTMGSLGGGIGGGSVSFNQQSGQTVWSADEPSSVPGAYHHQQAPYQSGSLDEEDADDFSPPARSQPQQQQQASGHAKKPSSGSAGGYHTIG